MRTENLFHVVAIAVLLLTPRLAPAADPAAPQYLADDQADRIVSVLQGWGTLGTNTAVRPTKGEPMPLRIKDKTYKRGLGHHASGQIVVDLEGLYRTFEAEIGIQWQGGKNTASAIFQVFVDDEKVFDSGVMGEPDAPRKVSIPVEGAELLRLVTTDAGDGIICDCTNWADARLIPDPKAAGRTPAKGLNITPFGRVVTWDPKRSEGTKAGRVAEFPAEDVILHRELVSAADGSYTVPTNAEGTGCLGLYWVEQRMPRYLVLEFADPTLAPPAEKVKLQAWTGESEWQGNWQDIEASPTKAENRWVYRLGYKDTPRGTQKIRWIFPPVTKPLVLKGLAAYSRTTCKTVTVRIESQRPAADGNMPIEIHNGEILEGPEGGSSTSCTWKTENPLLLKVRYSRPSPIKVDQTVLTFHQGEIPFGVALEDLLAADCIHVPHAGLFITRVPVPITLDKYLKQIAQRRTMLDRVRQLPDQSFPRAMAKVHNPVQDMGPMLVSLACDNRKFTVHRNGTINFRVTDRADGNYKSVVFRIGLNMAEMDCAQLRPCFGDGKIKKVTRHLDGGWLPMPVTTIDDAGLICRQRSYVAPVDERSADGAPAWLRRRAVCVAEYTIENKRPQAADARLTLALSENAAKNKAVQWKQTDGGGVAMLGGRLFASLDAAGAKPLVGSIESGTFRLAGKLPAGGKARLVVFLPAWNATASDAATERED